MRPLETGWKGSFWWVRWIERIGKDVIRAQRVRYVTDRARSNTGIGIIRKSAST